MPPAPTIPRSATDRLAAAAPCDHDHRQPAGDDDRLLTLDAVADLLDVPTSTVRYWRHRGEDPPSVKVGRSLRYWRSAVVCWISRQNDTDA